jgi:hypothetical protein
MASDLNSRDGAASRQTALKACRRVCASGRFSHGVPSCFQMKATASIRKISTPWLARKSISPAMARKTSGLE